MKPFPNARIKWPYATHLVNPARVKGLLPMVDGHDPGALVLARVITLGKHRDLEAHDGRRITLYVGDVFIGVLGDRYATDQFEGVGRVQGPLGHIIGIGGVLGEVVSMNNKMVAPTVIEYLGRLADGEGQPLCMSQFQSLPAQPLPQRGATTILSLGASMNAGKTTTAAQMIRSLTVAGHRVAAGKLTGTACLKDPNILYDAGAVAVLDFTAAGWPSTANLSMEQLLSIAGRIRAALQAHDPEFVILEIADGILQRETAMLLANDSFRASVDGVTFAGADALSCGAGVRRLRELGYSLLATAGIVANGPLGIAEVESACGVRCLPGETILAGGMVSLLRTLRGRTAPAAARNGAASPRGPERETVRSEEHTSELQSRFGISYAAFCLKKKKATTGQSHIFCLHPRKWPHHRRRHP